MTKLAVWLVFATLSLLFVMTVRLRVYAARTVAECAEPSDFFVEVVEPKMREREWVAAQSQRPLPRTRSEGLPLCPAGPAAGETANASSKACRAGVEPHPPQPSPRVSGD